MPSDHVQSHGSSAGTGRTSAVASLPDCQISLTKNTLGLIVVHHHALPAQQDVQRMIAETATLAGQLAHPLAEHAIIFPRRNPAVGIDDTARPLHVRPIPHFGISDRRLLCDGCHHFIARRSFDATEPNMTSARSRLKFGFSLYGSLSRLASGTASSPCLDFQLQIIVSNTRCRPAGSAVLVHASARFSTPIVSSFVNLVQLITNRP